MRITYILRKKALDIPWPFGLIPRGVASDLALSALIGGERLAWSPPASPHRAMPPDGGTSF